MLQKTSLVKLSNPPFRFPDSDMEVLTSIWAAREDGSRRIASNINEQYFSRVLGEVCNNSLYRLSLNVFHHVCAGYEVKRARRLRIFARNARIVLRPLTCAIVVLESALATAIV